MSGSGKRRKIVTVVLVVLWASRRRVERGGIGRRDSIYGGKRKMKEWMLEGETFGEEEVA